MSTNPVERIRDAVDVRKLMEHYGAQQIKGTNNVRSCCPIHSGGNSSAFVFSQSNKMYFCFTGCQEGGDCFDFVMKMEECTFIESAHKLAEMFHVKVDWTKEEVDENYFRDDARAFIDQMMKRSKVNVLPAFTPPKMKLSRITEFRGYSPETIEWWKLRYCDEGELQDRIVIPFEDVDKRLVGITGRAAAGQPDKFMHRPRNLHTGYFLTGLGRNLQHVQEAGGSVKIVEGVFDAARWYDSGFKNVCAPIGVFFTEEHVNQLFKGGVIQIELGFDCDKAGRNGIRKAIDRAKGKFDIYVLDYPEGKDADDCSKEELEEVDRNKLSVLEWYAKFGKELEK